MSVWVRVLLVVVLVAGLAGAALWALTGRDGGGDAVERTLPGPAVTTGAAVEVADVAYAPAEPDGDGGHLLDLYLPRELADGPVPLVIWSHGSAWRLEDGRDGADAVAERLVPRGYAVAGVAVRSSGVAKFPAQLWDLKAAVRYLRANAGELGIDPGRIAVMGESSGGWGAAMVGLTGDVDRLEGEIGVTGVSSAVQAVVPFYPPTDFLTMYSQVIPGVCPPGSEDSNDNCHLAATAPESQLLGCPVQECPDLVREASPARYAAEEQDVPPFLIVHGEQDGSVPYGQSRQLYDALAGAGHEATLFSVPEGTHSQWLDWLNGSEISVAVETTEGSGVSQDAAPTWDTVERFLARAFATARP